MSQTDTITSADRPGPPDELDAAAQALSAALEVDWADRPSSVMPEAVRKVAGLAAQLMVLDAEVVGAYDRSGAWSVDGHTSPAVGVRHECNEAAGTSRERIKRSRKLRHLDRLAAALAVGRVSADAAKVLLRADRPEVHDALLADERMLVDLAETLEHADLVTAVTMWDQLKDPDRADREANKRDEERSAFVSKVGDRVKVDAWMNRIGGAELLAELERREEKLFDADWAEARERLGDKATKDDLRRTPAQRRHDAMVEMARRSAAYTGDGAAPIARVIVNLHMDYLTFIAELARHTGADPTYPDGRLCEFDDGTPLVPSEALNLALGGEVRRIVFGPDGHVLDYGRSRRLFTKTLGDVIRARDGRCQHPGCLLPAARCQIDHVVESQHGGETSEANGEAVCRFHNNWKSNNLTAWRDVRDRNAGRFRKRRPPPRE